MREDRSAGEKKLAEKTKSDFKQAKSDAEKIWDLVSEETKEPEPLFSYQKNPVIFKNTIVLVQGKSGTHKSRLSSSLASLLVTDDRCKQLLGFQKASDDEVTLVYCDTERNITYQLPEVLKQILKDADIELDKLRSRFAILPLMNISRTNRINVMGEQFKELKQDKKNEDRHFVIVLDIVSDLIANFNDVEQTMTLIDLMNQAINTMDITFIVVIHENPGSVDKARGHLGTELNNKASTVFQISEQEKDCFKLKMLKSRITEKYSEVILRFDACLNNLVVVTDMQENFRLTDPNTFKLCQVLSENFFVTKNREDILKMLIGKLSWKERKIEGLLKKLIEERTEIQTPLGIAHLSKDRGKTAVYHMTLNFP